MSLTIGQQTDSYFVRLVNNYYASLGDASSVTTFNVFRRTTSGPPDDLGVPNNPYTLVHSNVICAVSGAKWLREKSIDVILQGQVQHPFLEIVTALLDVGAQDSIVLALDGRGYGIERVSRIGPLNVLLLDRADSQV